MKISFFDSTQFEIHPGIALAIIAAVVGIYAIKKYCEYESIKMSNKRDRY